MAQGHEFSRPADLIYHKYAILELVSQVATNVYVVQQNRPRSFKMWYVVKRPRISHTYTVY